MSKSQNKSKNKLELQFHSKESTLSVRQFSIHESISGLFSVEVMARSEKADIDLNSIVGKQASLKLDTGKAKVKDSIRYWTGICSHMELAHSETSSGGVKAESTYVLHIVPTAWLLTQRTNFRIFQHKNVPDIVDELLEDWKDWKIEATWKLDRSKYPKLEYKVQYDESDFDFLARIVAEAGISYNFPDNNKEGSKLTFCDNFHALSPRKDKLKFTDNPNQASELEFIADVELRHEVNVGAYVIRDYDFRKPTFGLYGKSTAAPDPESKYEIFDYRPGAFVAEVKDGGKDTPVADGNGVARHDPVFGQALAQRCQDAERVDGRTVSFSTNTVDLWPGMVFRMEDHPHAKLSSSAKLLVTSLTMEGAPQEAWETFGEAVFADQVYRSPMLPKPRVNGVQSATVVGKKGEEIHTDEHGRVKVQFPWWRDGKSDENSSCWIRASQGWAGTGFGLITIPRVGKRCWSVFWRATPISPSSPGGCSTPSSRCPTSCPSTRPAARGGAARPRRARASTRSCSKISRTRSWSTSKPRRTSASWSRTTRPSRLVTIARSWSRTTRPRRSRRTALRSPVAIGSKSPTRTTPP